MTLVINDNRYVPITPFNCVSRDLDAYNALLKYMNDKNKRESVFIDYELFKTKYMILYFDIVNNLTDVLKDTYCKLEFRYILNEDNFKGSLINGKSELLN